MKPAQRPTVIDSFTGEYFFLSNFYNWSVTFEGVTYPTNEHAFQAAKSTDEFVRNSIASANTSSEAKGLGRSIQLRPHWDECIRYDVMWELVRQKFSETFLRDWLRGTGDALLIEGNHWGDRTWGMVRTPYKDWEGHNLLGWMLMRMRAEL